ncbi:MAG: ATP-binding protein [Phenylobacterium sp.]|uniref:AlbA family DNA-binding domain-containing protein n=1 Tax=Phenylobacterium sp. TaxID=1871053 RepID=UPI001A54FBCB|nr:ATP-binding protein [Phenylobacterium sp.]MBL8770029.1 ATP-binding protein [Phenylobacterium sp.]
MAQRGLQDWEIALIKRMMVEEYARDRMHAYFNRPERTLTPAAFSEIKLGRFGSHIQPASAEELARFVETFSKSPAAAESDPIGMATLAKLLATEAGALKVSEDDQIEFKASFSFIDNTFSKIARAMAALANHRGGYILCGIEDGSGRVRGLPAREQFECDLARWAQVLKGCLMPVPVFERMITEVEGKAIGVIYVEPAENKPVIATKTFGDKIKDGAVYFRYPGQSTPIGYGEMVTLLAERDRRAQRGLLNHLNIYAERSPDDLALIDLKEGRLVDPTKPIALSTDMISRLNLIKQGEFVEKDGAPALRLIGDATAAAEPAPEIVRGFVTDQALMKNFAKRRPVAEPGQYFLAAINSSSEWLPMLRWMREAGISKEQAIALVENEGLTPTKRSRALGRLNGERSAYAAETPSVRLLRDRLLALETLPITSATDLRRVMLAIRAVETVTPEQLDVLWATLERAFDFAWTASNGGDLQSYVKAAAARVDELQAIVVTSEALNAA